MGPNYNYDTERKIPREEEVESVDVRFHEEKADKDEFRKFVKKILKSLQYISINIIHFGQETREFLAKELGVKDREGSSIGSQCKERKVMSGSIFSKTAPQSRPLKYRVERKLQP